MSKMQSLKTFGHKLDPITRKPTKSSGKAFGLCAANDLILIDQNGVILSKEKNVIGRWREYYKDLMNPVIIISSHTQHEVHLVEENITVKTLKDGKTVGWDEIRPEMLTEKDILAVSCVSSGMAFLERAPKDLQTELIIPMYVKTNRRKCINHSGISFLSLPEKLHVKCLEKVTAKALTKAG